MAHKPDVERSSRVTRDRRLTLCLSTLSLSFNTLSFFLLNRLPNDSFELAWVLSLYSLSSVVLGLVGLRGAINRDASSTYLFAYHLFSSAFISMIPRVLLLAIVSSLLGNLCSAGVSSPVLLSSSYPREGTTDFTGAARAPQQFRVYDGVWTADACQTFVQALQSVGFLMLLSMAAMQLWCANRVRVYAATLARAERDTLATIITDNGKAAQWSQREEMVRSAFLEKMIKDW